MQAMVGCGALFLPPKSAAVVMMGGFAFFVERLGLSPWAPLRSLSPDTMPGQHPTAPPPGFPAPVLGAPAGRPSLGALPTHEHFAAGRPRATRS